MNDYVPDFEMDEDSSIPTPSSLTRSKRSLSPQDEIMELLWQNGQVVMHNQTQRPPSKKSPPSKPDHPQSTARDIRPPSQQQPQQQQQQQHLFVQEDEMASWLHYPLHDANFDTSFCADLLYPNQHPHSPLRPVPLAFASTSARPPTPPARRADAVQNFAHFSRHRARGGASESGPSNLSSVVRESTVVDSSDTQVVGAGSAAAVDSRVSEEPIGVAGFSGGGGGGSSAAVTVASCEMTATSSLGGSSASAVPPAQKAAVAACEDRKRKGREEEIECQSEDADFESADAKKQVRGSTSTKRSRAAEVHNLSERKRRDRINEKMRALQELIPRCNKSDKASMLDEAIDYLKSLKLQVQMMTMGCSMVPMMFPSIQQYMPPMGMGLGIGMDMGVNRPMMPFPNVLAGTSLPTPAAAAHLGLRFPMPSFHMAPVPAPEPSSILAASQADPMLSSLGAHNPNNQPRLPHFADPYQQYLGLHQMQIGIPQNLATARPSTSKPSTSRGAENLDDHQSGT